MRSGDLNNHRGAIRQKCQDSKECDCSDNFKALNRRQGLMKLLEPGLSGQYTLYYQSEPSPQEMGRAACLPAGRERG